MFDRRRAMMLTGERLDLLAACRIPGISWELIAREAQRSGGLKRLLGGELLEHSRAADEARVLLPESAGTAEERRQVVLEEHDAATKVGARLITVLDEDYPANLRVIVNLPPFLYVLGSLLPEDAKSVAVVGTRQPSPEGRRESAKMARALVERGVTVISGLAAGIDAAAHTAALDAGGRTVAVMGTGILGRYPKENADLAERIAGSGALISQFWPDAPPRRYSFPKRNVVTSGIGQGTVVIEASSTSGAKMQARLAIEHGKTVFLIKSLVLPQKWAQDYVKRHGRRIVVVESVDDVMAHLRPVEQIEELTSQRRQLAFDLS
jgi:DNA processing protein